MRWVLVAACIGTALSGCQVRGTGERWMSDAEIDAKDESVCRSYGAAPGSQAYVQCRLSLRQNRSHEDSLRRAALIMSN